MLEDQTLVLNLYRTLIESFTSHEVVLSCDTGEAFLQGWSPALADVVILDLVLPDMDGLQVAKRILDMPGTSPRILVVSGEVTEVTMRRAAKLRVDGFVDKVASSKILLQAIDEVLAGRRFFSANMQSIYERALKSSEAIDLLLTRKELRLVPQMALGLSNREIAEAEGMAESTVQTHRRNAMSKLNIRSAVDLVRHSLRSGVIVRLPNGTLSAPPWDDWRARA